MEASVNTLLMAVGGALCALVSVVALRGQLAGWRRKVSLKKRREVSQQAFYQELLETAAKAKARLQRERPWEGIRPLLVTAVVDECTDVRSFYLADPEGKPLPPFLPGQYLTFHLPADASKPDAKVVRCYSLSDRPREEYYRVSVKRFEGGAGSHWLHDNVQAGNLLPVAAPAGDFTFQAERKTPVVLIAGGIGITPIVSMLNTLLHTGSKRDVYLVLGMRNGSEFPFQQHLLQVLEAAPHVRPFFAFSQPQDNETVGEDFHHIGHVTLDYLREVLPSNNFRFFLCGPPRMMQTLVPGLLDWGVPDDRVHFEAFGPASIQLAGERDIASQAIGMKVRFAQAASEAVWSEECQSLLDLAERSGVPIESGCRVGNCGRCVTRVMEGQVTTLKSPGAQAPAGACLACISVPTSPLVLDV